MAIEFRARKHVLLMIYVAAFCVFTTSTKGRIIPPIFIFGDSTVDVGTNNLVENCSARADHPYNGIDYPGSQATGRFSNGLTVADTIVRLLGGHDLSPLPYLTLVEDGSNFMTEILIKGSNFASGGAGLAKSIGKKFGKVISMEEQVQQFSMVRGNITSVLGESKGDRLLQKSMYIFSIGSNDVTNYALTFPRIMTREQFVINVTATYAIHLKNLYSLGARKFGIISIPPIGCSPFARSMFFGACVDDANSMARVCHASFESLLKNLSSTLEGFKYSLANTYNLIMNVITKKTGFKDVVSACCEYKTLLGLKECQKGAHVCEHRDDYLFWDAFHLTEKASEFVAAVLVSSQDPDMVSPTNFGTLRKA